MVKKLFKRVFFTILIVFFLSSFIIKDTSSDSSGFIGWWTEDRDEDLLYLPLIKGEDGSLRKFSCQVRAMDYPIGMKSLTEPVEEKITHTCKGKVTNKDVENDQHFIECDVWVENEKGEKTTPGKATILLKTKEADNE